MTDEEPTLEERVGWLEDRMDAIEAEMKLVRNTLGESHNAGTILFNGLISFLVKEGKMRREGFTSYMQAQIELSLTNSERPLLKQMLRARVDGLMTEELDELHGADLDEFRRNVLRDLHSGEAPPLQNPLDE